MVLQPVKLDRSYDKSVKINIFENETVVSWDLCKPAFQLNDEIVVSQMIETNGLKNLRNLEWKISYQLRRLSTM